MQKIFPFLGFLLTLNVASAQNFKPSPPLDIPLVLSGTFAELRGNHFHGGIDIKTQGRSGLKVQAIADGYVSRVAVSPYGYGNAIYVRHPEGYTSVYGHLNAFYPELERWVEQQLRDRSKNDGNLYPRASDFKVVRGQFIAFSGNTGGSFGPHLHFEIRDTKTEEPLNPLDFGIEVLDSKKPGLHAIGWVNEALTRNGTAKFRDTIYASEPIGLDLGRPTSKIWRRTATVFMGLHAGSVKKNYSQRRTRASTSVVRATSMHISTFQGGGKAAVATRGFMK